MHNFVLGVVLLSALAMACFLPSANHIVELVYFLVPELLVAALLVGRAWRARVRARALAPVQPAARDFIDSQLPAP